MISEVVPRTTGPSPVPLILGLDWDRNRAVRVMPETTWLGYCVCELDSLRIKFWGKPSEEWQIISLPVHRHTAHLVEPERREESGIVS